MDMPHIITDAEAREAMDEKALADRAIDLATRYGQPTSDPVAAIFDNRVKRQALSLLYQAARWIIADQHSLHDETLALMDLHNKAHCDDHERLADIAEAIVEHWERETEDERERV